MVVQVTRPPPKRPEPKPVRRRSPPPRQKRKSGFRPFLKAAVGRARILRGETFAGQFYRVLAFLFIVGLLGIAAVEAERRATKFGAVALAANEWCAKPRPLSHVSACKDFACLASINEDNARYVRICHPEALRS